MTGQENERGAPYSNFETNCPNVEKGKRATPNRGCRLFVFPQQTTGINQFYAICEGGHLWSAQEN